MSEIGISNAQAGYSQLGWPSPFEALASLGHLRVTDMRHGLLLRVKEEIMTKVQFIKTAGGEELAILPKSEYERLVKLLADEDVGTARVVRNAREKIASGLEVMLPKAVVDRLAAHENPIRVLREWRAMTQDELAVAVSITQGYLSDLEAGKRKGPVALHQKISRELGVPIDLLLPIAVSEQEADPVRIAKRSHVAKDMVQRARARRGR
jgi:DNA-binding XRE family transcriptional regulator